VAWIIDQQEADGGFELADFPGFETPDAVLAIAEAAQDSPTWDRTSARAAVDAVVSTDGKTPLDHLDDLVEQLVQIGPDDTVSEVAARGAQLTKILALVIVPLRTTPGIAFSDFDPSGDSADPVDIRPAVLLSEGNGTYPFMTFSGRLYVLLVGAAQAGPAPLIEAVRDAQQANGAWNFAGAPSGDGADADTTGLALQALGVAGVAPGDAVVRRGLAALAGAQQDDGSWLSFGVADPNSTSLAVLGIRATGGDPQTSCWREATNPAWAGVPYAGPLDWLRSRAATDGHIRSPGDEFGVTTFATSQTVQAILGLNPVIAGDPPAAPACATASPEVRLVHALYVDLLGRLADTGGALYQAGRLGAGASVASVVRSLTASGEYRRALVDRFYQDYLGRPADRAGLATWSPWTTVLRTEVQAKLLASGEYFTKAGGTNGGFVDALFRDVLGRSADPGGRAAFVSLLDRGRSRYAVAKTLLTSPEGWGHVVDDLYRHFLRRPSDSSGRAFWRARLAAGTSVEGVIAALAGSTEYIGDTAAA
jgi:hypothetical protein